LPELAKAVDGAGNLRQTHRSLWQNRDLKVFQRLHGAEFSGSDAAKLTLRFRGVGKTVWLSPHGPLRGAKSARGRDPAFGASLVVRFISPRKLGGTKAGKAIDAYHFAADPEAPDEAGLP
jgi:hypothetical protein